jgi:branched-subunit amino acid aminotransferase/4-amino-4-deoxychorismate lyase
MKQTAKYTIACTRAKAGPKTAKYWIDGRLVDQSEAAIPLTDLAVTRGYAAFDSLRTYGNVPFLLDAHLKRLENTCVILHLKPPLERKNIARAVLATVAANKFPESLIRIYVTGGDASGLIPENKERLVILVDPLRAYPARHYVKGIVLATTRLNRVLPLAKSTDYLAGVWETTRARKKGFDEVVFIDRQRNILEGTTFNVVAIIGRKLVSRTDGVLRGITVEHVLGLAREAGLSVRRVPISPRMLAKADEIFVTSSIREIIPVVCIDDKWIGSGFPGPVTRLLHQRYHESALAIRSQGR